MHLETQIADFMNGKVFAVAGASNNRAKYGNKVLRCFQQHGLTAIPVNPNENRIEGVQAVASLEKIHPAPHAVSIITPPAVTEQIVEDAIRVGIRHIWMQPGAESRAAIESCRAAGTNLLHSGPCILVVLGYSER